ncbi:MAG TPA: diaminopimelate epimerase [Propionibacteriaceae bacterium]
METWSFAKGHGTRNDFVILPDLDGVLDLTPAKVSYLCDRRSGIGADGVLRVVKARAIQDSDVDPDLWFMDYRNADGSIAEMCGNGLRVFARYLAEEGLSSNAELTIATRAGLRWARLCDDGRVTVGMGRVTTGPTTSGTLGSRTYEGAAVDVGNPHLVVTVATAQDVTDAELRDPFTADPVVFPHGVNFELVHVVGAQHAVVRVLERGVGETEACGTGAVAVARVVNGEGPGTVRVDFPGGTVEVTFAGDGTATLTGPAVILARGDVEIPEDLP